MKKILFITMTLLVMLMLLSLPFQVTAQEPDPAAVIQAIYEAIEAKDIDAAMELVADDAVLVLIPAPAGLDGTFVGKEEIRDWWEGLAADNGRAEFSDVTVSGNTATWKAKWWSGHFEDMGVAPAEFEGVNVVQDGLFKSATWVFTEEFLTRLEAAASPAEPAAPAEPKGLRPDAPPYAVRGPYAVGARDFVIQDGDEPIYITVWYPALNPKNLKEEITYDLSNGQTSMYEIPASPITDLSLVTVKGDALRDAAPDVAHGPYPLVVFSEALAAWRHWHAYLHEHLASQGFVVIAGDPREVFESFWKGAATRPMDTVRIIAYADELTTTSGPLAGLIDTEHVAVTGHSSGGWTALMGGGAQFDFSWCAANPEFLAEHFINNCDRFVPHQEEIAEMLGLETAPTGLWPQNYDPRVDAVAAFAPDGDIWGADFGGVENVTVPTMLMVGTQDLFSATTIDPIYEHLGSEAKSLVVFENGDHMVFITQCEDLPWIVDTSGYWFCADAVWDMDRAHDLVKHFTTAFLLAELKGDAEAAAALAPENVTFAGITYETTAE